MAFIYDMVVVILHIVGYTLGTLITIISVAVVFSKASQIASDTADIVNNIDSPTLPSSWPYYD